MTRADLHTLTGAYAVHALSGRELEEFERHLAVCEACAQEVGELRETAGRLAVASSLTPSPLMKDEVMRRIATVRQEPPRVAAHDGRDDRRTQEGRSGARESHAGPRRRGGRRRGLDYALAACLAGATALGGAAVWQYRQASDARDTAGRAERRVAEVEELARVLAAPDARTRSGRLTDGATGAVVVSRGLDRAAFLASGLPEPPSGRVYQLWFSDGGTMRSAGLLHTKDGGTATLLHGPVGQASAMGLTVEPAGGSKAPTTDPVALMTFPSG
ncbi:anti-sigma factor [Streptomyces sp. NA02950]|uniref:anti-sigma factor n=1 Tax=Streptomyces sp. NA02950 TaxID=2742137 RepID=UPI001591D694|nr:anti-sigma factor [Streptomyces sp. NA02950]QKV91819.1 anti-sigma factor [Streptomyces sp. NA02950]